MSTGIAATDVTRRRVPPVVIGSSLMLALSGLARLAQAAAEAAVQGAYLRAHERVGTPSGFAALPMVFLMAVGLVVALSALAFLALALANLGGWNWTRIVTWILGAVTLVFAGFWLVLNLLPSDDGVSALDGTDWDSVHALAGRLMPGWAEPVGAVSGYVASPALLVALVLLALPPTNAFYRRQRISPYEPLILYPGATLPHPSGRP
ncbi:hypothetical protein [Micromonospora avicenniae]|uniref:Uncharacterized protein n=1 Tax=Micromonospora avicenniae TaxID=1198245 RepID=A0A1N7DEP2_9ACTN|nr:hypothetical protein [Micromonospora avicenniae]SIR74254.1 hypothetical protein SAMN05444858_11676 [Micromonospora avicenniae]